MPDLLTPMRNALNEAERKKHLSTIERLTEQCGMSRTEVGKLYEAELDRILASTRIRDYLPILIARKIRQSLRENQPTTVS